MNLRLFLLARWNQWRNSRTKRAWLQGPPEPYIRREDWSAGLENPSAFYQRCFRFFHQHLPQEIRAHRDYFTKARRGFGEDAFHTMWFLIYQEFKPRKFLEIGVYRGQVLSLLSLLQQRDGPGGKVVGVSPFLSTGDSVSRYREDVEYHDDTLRNFAHFSLPVPTLHRLFSTDEPAVEIITGGQWDCAYIDGNHDYEVALADWRACARGVRVGGLIVLDDSGLMTPYQPPGFATRGHPGPSQVATEIDPTRFKEILQVGHNRVFQKISNQ